MVFDPAEQIRRTMVKGVRSFFNGTANGERAVTPSDEALFAPDTPIRLVHADIAAMMVGGLSALLMQMLHPHALQGVLDHSTFRSDLQGRLRRTARFIAVTTYGHRDEAGKAIDAVNRIHEKVFGQLPDGTPYAAMTPSLLGWVHLSEATSFLAAYRRYVRPAMPQAERDRYFAQFAVIARRLHADPVPDTEAQAIQLIQTMRAQLVGSAAAKTVANEILTARGKGLAMPVQPLLAAAALDLLPPFAAEMLDLRQPRMAALPVRAGTFAIGRTLRWAFAGERKG